MTREGQFEMGEPLPLDDGWWAAVMQEDEAHWRGNGRPASGRRINGHGSAQSVFDPAADWEAARHLYESDEPVELEVVGYNRGGVLVSFRSLQGFVPSSHLLSFPTTGLEEERKQALARRVGGQIRLKVIEYDPAKGRVVFSERAALAEPGSRHSLLQKLQPGDVVRGTVTNICDFGVFVDLGGIEGLVHVSEVSWSRVAHPRDVVSFNQPIEVSVLSVDREQSRVALSLKRLRPDPWATVEQRYVIGQMVEGKVTNVVNFGAFVCVEDGLEGLVHISELADGQFMHPRNVVREGEQVRACIVSIDGAHRRLGLSLRRAGTVRGPGQ